MDATEQWYLANGKKKVGPWSTSRVMKRISAGKIPSKTLAWREGMEEWKPVSRIHDFAIEETLLTPSQTEEISRRLQGIAEPDSDSETEIAAEVEPQAKKAKKAKKATEKKTPVAKKKSKTSKPRAAPATAGAFTPLYRIGWLDVWKGYGMGLDRRRVGLVFASLGLGVLISGVIAGIGQVAGMAHFLLALPFVFVAGLVAFAFSMIGLGALSYDSRHRLTDQEPPTIKESLSWAVKRGFTLTITPILLSIAWLVPLTVLVLITLLVKVPYLGPVGTGLLFGVHIALGALTVFLVITAGLGSVFGPIVVGFEETGVIATIKSLMSFVKRSTARVFLWSVLPSMAFTPFSILVFGIGAVILALPLGLTFMMVGGDVMMWVQMGMVGDPPIGGITVGAIPLALWLGLFAAGMVSILGSVNNSLLSFVYLGGREGNDSLISRDVYLAKRASEES